MSQRVPHKSLPTEAPQSLSLVLRVTKLEKGQETPSSRVEVGGQEECKPQLAELHLQHTIWGLKGHPETYCIKKALSTQGQDGLQFLTTRMDGIKV